MKRIAAATLWLAIGHALVGGLFWLLVNIPESNIATLTTSALVVVVLVTVAAMVEGAAVVCLEERAGARGWAVRVPAVLFGFLAAACVFWLMWATTGRVMRWLDLHAGEMDAWLLLHFNITRTAWLHSLFAWLLTAVRYVAGLSLAAALVAEGTVEGVASIVHVGDWVGRAVSPRRLVLIAGCWAVLLWIPWMASTWRPRALPVTAEPVFVAAKLALLYLAANLGIALILRAQMPPAAASPHATSPVA